MTQFKMYINGNELIVETVSNSSSEALIRDLQKSDIKLEMKDYANMEKFGVLEHSYPRNDEYFKTTCRDVILYEGNILAIYYNPNSWNFTKIGRIININDEEYKEVLGNGDVTALLSLD